jgi:hypothetical protein
MLATNGRADLWWCGWKALQLGALVLPTLPVDSLHALILSIPNHTGQAQAALLPPPAQVQRQRRPAPPPAVVRHTPQHLSVSSMDLKFTPMQPTWITWPPPVCIRMPWLADGAGAPLEGRLLAPVPHLDSPP